ncbi:MAG: protein-(glutamine-N5) methyltransferase, release factor-specific, partial [Halothiobacillaceae bacterium]
MNIAKLLAASALRLLDSESPRADAEILLAHVMRRSRSYFVAWPEAQVSLDEAAAFEALLARRV